MSIFFLLLLMQKDSSILTAAFCSLPCSLIWKQQSKPVAWNRCDQLSKFYVLHPFTLRYWHISFWIHHAYLPLQVQQLKRTGKWIMRLTFICQLHGTDPMCFNWWFQYLFFCTVATCPYEFHKKLATGHLNVTRTLTRWRLQYYCKC
jgi:hypothetical protein